MLNHLNQLNIFQKCFKPVSLFSCIDPILVGSHPGDIIDELDDTFDQPILHVLDNHEVINATRNVTRPTQEGTITLKKMTLCDLLW